MEAKHSNRRYFVVLAALCGSIAAGVGLVTNIAGLFFTPVAQALGVGRGSVSLTMTISNLTYAVGGMLLTKIMRDSNFKKLLLLSALVTVGSTLLLAFSSQLWMLYVLNALRGFSSGFMGTVMATLIVNNWFHSKNGLLTSVVMGFSGLTSAVLSPMFSRIIASAGWKNAYMISAALMLVLYLPIILSRISMTPQAVGEIPYGEGPEDAGSKSDRPEKAKHTKSKPAAARQKTSQPDHQGEIHMTRDEISRGRLMACLIYAVFGGCLAGIVQHFPGVADSYQLPAAIGAVMLSASMITNTSGKLIIGVLIDSIGVVKAILIMAAAVAIGVVLMIFVRQPASAVAGAALIGLSYSLATVGVAMMTREIFGPANYGIIYSRASLCVTVSYALAAAGIGYLYDFLHSYSIVFWTMLALIAGMILLVFYAYRKPKEE